MLLWPLCDWYSRGKPRLAARMVSCGTTSCGSHPCCQQRILVSSSCEREGSPGNYSPPVRQGAGFPGTLPLLSRPLLPGEVHGWGVEGWGKEGERISSTQQMSEMLECLSIAQGPARKNLDANFGGRSREIRALPVVLSKRKTSLKP